MNTPKPFVVAHKSGQTFTYELKAESRSAEQFESVRAITEREGFEHLCQTPEELFGSLTSISPGTMEVTYYRNGRLHLAKIGKRGNFLKEKSY